MEDGGIVYVPLVYFMIIFLYFVAIWYILWPFGIFFPFWYVLATLIAKRSCR
jgi:hypothetical protein